AVDRLTEGGQTDQLSASICDRGGVEREPGNHAGQRDADGHVVVDSDHVGPQALIDGNCLVRTEAASGRRVVPVEVRHGNFPLCHTGPPAGSGWVPAAKAADTRCAESSAGIVPAPDATSVICDGMS